MSFQAMAWAIKQSVGDPSAKWLLVTLANYADEHGVCWPSMSRLAADTELSRQGVMRKLQHLYDKGLVAKEQKKTPGGTYNVYTLSQGDTPSTTVVPPLVAQCDHPSTKVVPKPIREPNKTEPIIERASPLLELKAVLSEETAKAIVEHRKAMRKPLTPRAAKQLAERLKEYHDPEAGAARMLERGWTGFDPEWMKQTERAAGGKPSTAWSGWFDEPKKAAS